METAATTFSDEHDTGKSEDAANILLDEGGMGGSSSLDSLSSSCTKEIQNSLLRSLQCCNPVLLE